MYGTTFLLLYLFMGMITAQQPSFTIVTNSSSFQCSNEYLVVGEDFVTFEVDLAGNNSDYTYNEFEWPRFRINELSTDNGTITVVGDMLICLPFDLPENGFCVKRDIVDTTGCSCEVVGPQVYRVKTVYRIKYVSESRGRIQLLWPSISGPLSRFHNLPDVQESCPTTPTPTPTPSGPAPGGKKLEIWIIIIVVAAVGCIGIVICCLIRCKKKLWPFNCRNRPHPEVEPKQHPAANLHEKGASEENDKDKDGDKRNIDNTRNKDSSSTSTESDTQDSEASATTDNKNTRNNGPTPKSPETGIQYTTSNVARALTNNENTRNNDFTPISA